MVKKEYIGAAVLLAFAGMASLLWLAQDAPMSAPSRTDATLQAQGIAPSAATIISVDQQAVLTATLIKALEVGPDGHLGMTLKTRRAMDVFLQALGTQPSTEMITNAQSQLHAQMKEPAATEAGTLLAQYAAYRRAVTNMDISSPILDQAGSDDMLAAGVKLQRLGALRSQYLSAEVVQSFFADEDAYQQFMLARKRLLSMNELSDEQREQQIAALRDQLPQLVRDTIYRDR